MEIHQNLANLLNDYRYHNPELKGWRFDLHTLKGFEIGLKNNQIGGPYSAPSYKRSITGELYLIWENEKYTSAKLDAQSVGNFQEYINLWRNTAYFDQDGVGLYSPEQIPSINLADPLVTKIIEKDVEIPFRLLDHGLHNLKTLGFHKVDGKVKCFEDYRVLMNSDGLKVEYYQTPVEFYFVVNDLYGESYQEKKWPSELEIHRVIGNTGRIGKLLEKQVQAKISGQTKIIFPPAMLESFLNYYLITNLHGNLVVNRQSSYLVEDFRMQKPVLRDDLSLEVDSTLPFRSFSYRCTTEGVPAGSVSLITSGRLQTPLLNLKYAKKTGWTPTPVPVGGKGFFLKSKEQIKNWDRLLENTEQGLIIYSVLGLHTQDASSGHFSLSADQCLLIEKGEVVGKVKSIINGDFLSSLPLETSELSQVEGEDNPGYSFLASAACG